MKRILVLVTIMVMLIAAIPTNTAAEWVEPVPASEEDDEYWHITYDFKEWWAENFDREPGNSNREPDIEYYDGKLWYFWEGIMVPNEPQQPVSYKGKMYLRSYDDRSNETDKWSEIIEVTPDAYYSDHTNQKGRMVVFKDKLYMFWQSNDRNQKPQGWPEYQFDILMRTYDGNEMNELTPPEIISRQGREDMGGYDQFPYPIVYKEKLYVIWFWEDLEEGISDILYRAYDGNTWSDINVLSEFPNDDTDNVLPSAAVWKDRLYVMWQRTEKAATVTEAVYAYTDDGETWTDVTPLSREMDRSFVSFDVLSAMTTYDNPRTGKLELHAVWRTYGTEATKGGLYDYDLVTRVWDGENWGQTRELSPQYDKWDDTYPDMIEFKDELHIFWSTKDNSVTDGEDYDIVRIIYDGETYSPPETISRLGDRDGVLFDDNEWWNLGDDQWSRSAIYPNQWGEDRLFVSWWTFDYITGCCYDDPEGATPVPVLTLLEDSDHDKDGYTDFHDDCPEDADGYIDSDEDGVCDATDWRPQDPEIWKKPKDAGDGWERPTNDPLPLYIIIVVLLVIAVALMAYRGSKKKPRPDTKPKERGKKSKGKKKKKK